MLQQPPQNLSADTIEGLFEIYKVDIQGGLPLDTLLHNNLQCCYLRGNKIINNYNSSSVSLGVTIDDKLS